MKELFSESMTNEEYLHRVKQNDLLRYRRLVIANLQDAITDNDEKYIKIYKKWLNEVDNELIYRGDKTNKKERK